MIENQDAVRGAHYNSIHFYLFLKVTICIFFDVVELFFSFKSLKERLIQDRGIWLELL